MGVHHRPQFMFSVPNLPKLVWLVFKQFVETHQVSHRGAVIAGIKALTELEQEAPEKLQEILKWASKFE